MAQDAIINRWDINGDVYDIQDAGRGRPLGVATLDENGRVPYTQLPESAIEFKGYWNASTNTPTLHDGTGTKGDLYYVDVAGTQDLGSGSQTFDVGDRVLYDGSIWKNMKSGGTDIEVYPTMADLQQDLPNLEDGTIVATEEGDNFTTVDTVQSGVFNPVTSNAVAQALGAQVLISNIFIGTYTLQAGQTISPDISSSIPATPQGYARFTQVYGTQQNYLQSSVQHINGRVYMTLTNHYTGPLTYDIYTWVMYFKNAQYI